ncbi:MAG: pirin family protein [Gammaproteobacteria bacterium]|nr:pirin family protein [Gammaproteobacteria bacterium]
MSYLEATEPVCTGDEGAIELLIDSRSRDLGGFSVRRVLPASERRMVGPFIFFDHMGPAEFPPGKGIQVRPHPHIGLATVTYLFEGEILHRDSLGVVQPIRPGAVNLMTAGRGIVHSERAGEDLNVVSRLHGIQSWMALPADQEERAPDFAHFSADQLPEIDRDGVTVRVIMGAFEGRVSPVPSYSPTLYLEARMAEGAVLELPSEHEELAAYVVSGEVAAGPRPLGAGLMAVARSGRALHLKAAKGSHVMVIGGAGLGSRHIWWNFVSSSRDRIQQAKSDWKQGRFDGVPGETEFIPLPE